MDGNEPIIIGRSFSAVVKRLNLPEDRFRMAAAGLLGGLAGVTGEKVFLAVEGRPVEVTPADRGLSLDVTVDLERHQTLSFAASDIERIETKWVSHRIRAGFRAMGCTVATFLLLAGGASAVGLLKENANGPWDGVIIISVLIACLTVATLNIVFGWKRYWELHVSLTGGGSFIIEIPPRTEAAARQLLVTQGIVVMSD